VHRHAERIEHDGFGALVGKQVHVIGPGEPAGHFAGGVVIAAHHQHARADVAQAVELADEEQAGVEVLPLAVEDVAGEQQEGGALVDAQLHQVGQRAPGRPAHPLDGRAVVRRQPLEGTVDVKVGGVDEFHAFDYRPEQVFSKGFRAAIGAKLLGMANLRRVLVLALFSIGSVASAKAPPGQGRACDAKTKCDSGLTCVQRRDARSTCEITCAANTRCPEDQRCVKDGAAMVCRPINDGVGL
jgi:hypothetical protein